MAALNFPTSPTLGQKETLNGKEWMWNGSVWNTVGNSLTSSDIGTTVQAYDADIPTVSASQAEMVAGTETALRSMSPLRVAQAIAALGGGGGAGVTLSGNISLYVKQHTTLTITNYNVFSTYGVAVSAGSVSRTEDSISFAAPDSAQTVTLTVTMDGVVNEFAIVIQAAGVPTTIGQAFGGGFYAGKINDGGTQYYLIVAPKLWGESPGLEWKTTDTSTTGTASVIAGPTNSANMDNDSHPAAQFCEELTVGGYHDWYLPAKNELEVLYYFLKPTSSSNDAGYGSNANAVSPEPISTGYLSGSPARTSAAAFQSGGAEAFAVEFYWSSTQSGATFAWSQFFGSGMQADVNKGSQLYVRACRRIAV